MTLLVAHLVIALAFMAVAGGWTASGFLAGLLLGALVLTLLPPATGRIRYGTRIWRILKLLAVFLWEFSLSVARVARLVASPTMRCKPGIFRFPLSLGSDAEITLLANLITLTPGTLTVDVTADRGALIVHAVDCADPDAARRDIARGFERLIREAFE